MQAPNITTRFAQYWLPTGMLTVTSDNAIVRVRNNSGVAGIYSVCGTATFSNIPGILEVELVDDDASLDMNAEGPLFDPSVSVVGNVDVIYDNGSIASCDDPVELFDYQLKRLESLAFMNHIYTFDEYKQDCEMCDLYSLVTWDPDNPPSMMLYKPFDSVEISSECTVEIWAVNGLCRTIKSASKLTLTQIRGLILVFPAEKNKPLDDITVIPCSDETPCNIFFGDITWSTIHHGNGVLTPDVTSMPGYYTIVTELDSTDEFDCVEYNMNYTIEGWDDDIPSYIKTEKL